MFKNAYVAVKYSMCTVLATVLLPMCPTEMWPHGYTVIGELEGTSLAIA